MSAAATFTRWMARTTIEVMAVTTGVASLPVVAPLVFGSRMLRSPALLAVDWAADGTTPFVGPPVARAIDRMLGVAA
jgi:hypothetical protein